MKHLKKFEGKDLTSGFDFEFIQNCFQDLYDEGWRKFSIDSINNRIYKIGINADYPELNGKYIYDLLIAHPSKEDGTTAIHANGRSFHFTKHSLDVDFNKEEEYQDMMNISKSRLEEEGYIVYFSKGQHWMSIYIIK